MIITTLSEAIFSKSESLIDPTFSLFGSLEPFPIFADFKSLEKKSVTAIGVGLILPCEIVISKYHDVNLESFVMALIYIEK